MCRPAAAQAPSPHGARDGGTPVSTRDPYSIWRRMPVEQMEDEEERNAGGTLAKSLGLWQLTAIGVSCIIGRAGSAYTYGYVALGEIIGCRQGRSAWLSR